MSDATNNPKPYLTVPEIARELHVSEEKVRTWCRSGQLRAVNVGDSRRAFYRVALADWQRFKDGRSQPLPPRVARLRPRSGTNLLGI